MITVVPSETGINASGQIAGIGIHNNQVSGFLLTPVPPTQEVTIDIKPGDPSNTINLRSHGVIPVAILSSASFDALQVDPATVRLAGAAVKVAGNSGHFLAHAEDVNGDGLPDLLCQVYTDQFTVEEGATTAVLEARTFGGQLLQGEDTITIVGNR